MVYFALFLESVLHVIREISLSLLSIFALNIREMNTEVSALHDTKVEATFSHVIWKRQLLNTKEGKLQ